MQRFESPRIVGARRCEVRRRRMDPLQRQCRLQCGADALRAQLPCRRETRHRIAHAVARGQRVPLRVEHAGKVAAGGRVTGTNAQGFLQREPGFIQLARVLQRQSEVVPRLREGRAARDGLAVTHCRLSEVGKVVQHQTEGVRKDRFARIQPARPGQHFTRFVELPALVRDHPQPVQRACVIGRLRHDRPEQAQRFVSLTGAVQAGCRAEGEFDVGQGRHASRTGGSRTISGR